MSEVNIANIAHNLSTGYDLDIELRRGALVDRVCLGGHLDC
jgi:hypothetical protein